MKHILPLHYLMTILLVASSTLFNPVLAETPAKVTQALSKLVPGLKPDSIRPAPIKGMYEVAFGGQVIYITSDGKFFIRGDVVDLARGANLTEVSRQKIRGKLINDAGEKSMITYTGKDTRYTVTVFSDIDCSYCRKFHGEMAEYNKLGIRVRYMAYPRSGVNTPSYYKAVSVWCAKDRNKAMTLAKQGKQPKSLKCDNPVKQHMLIGEKLGVRGTPSIILPGGKLLPGYVPPEKLIKVLELETADTLGKK